MKILLATDGTEYSENAVKMLSGFSLGEGDSIKIISVIDMALPVSIDVYGGFVPPDVEFEQTVRENADKILKDSAEKVRVAVGDNAEISTDVLFGSPESRIVKTAEEINADLIIVRSHGYNSWERLLLGSVSNSVVQHAPYSVLVVRNTKS